MIFEFVFFLYFLLYFLNFCIFVGVTMGEKKKKEPSPSRKWLLTFNNPAEHNATHEEIKAVLSKIKGKLYYCMCDEIGGNTSCYHTHLFIHRPSPFTFQQIKKMFPSAHIDYCFGSNQENRDYIRKEGKYKDTEKALTNLIDTFEENGECPEEHQGKRNDLHMLYDMIKSDCSTYEILEANPNYMKQLDKIDHVREVLRYEEFKNKRRLDLQVEYWYGEPGIGKSRAIRDKYGDGNVYCVSDTRNPWDSYRGQDVVLFDDFRCDMFRIEDLLRWCDIYPLELPCRYRNKQACYTKVYFTSNVAFDLIYTHIQQHDPQTWKALCRRIHCIKKFEAGIGGEPHIVEYQNIDEYLTRYRKTSGFIEISEEEQMRIDALFGS